MPRYKIIMHIIAWLLILFAVYALHQASYNMPMYQWMGFFGIVLKVLFVFDLGIVCLIIAFVIEFYMSFKPIEIKT